MEDYNSHNLFWFIKMLILFYLENVIRYTCVLKHAYLYIIITYICIYVCIYKHVLYAHITYVYMLC